MCNLTFGFIYPEEPSDEGSLRDPSLCSESLRAKPCTLPTGRQAMTTLLDILR